MLKIGEEFKEVIKGLSLQEYVLFTGSSSSEITLSDTILNYNRVVVYCSILGANYSLVINGNGTWPSVGSKAGYFNSSYYALRVIYFHVFANGNKITPSVIGQNYCIDLKTNGTLSFYDNIESLLIKKVVGYK